MSQISGEPPDRLTWLADSIAAIARIRVLLQRTDRRVSPKRRAPVITAIANRRQVEIEK